MCGLTVISTVLDIISNQYDCATLLGEGFYLFCHINKPRPFSSHKFCPPLVFQDNPKNHCKKKIFTLLDIFQISMTVLPCWGRATTYAAISNKPRPLLSHKFCLPLVFQDKPPNHCKNKTCQIKQLYVSGTLVDQWSTRTFTSKFTRSNSHLNQTKSGVFILQLYK